MKLTLGWVRVAIALTVIGCGRSERAGAPPEVIAATSSALSVLTRSGWTSDFNGAAGDTANALDGNLSTGWSSGRNALNNDAFTVDMKTRQTFGELTIDAGTATNDYLRGFQVRVSDDNSTWTTVATATGTSALVNVAFAVQTARYVQVKLTAGFASWWTIKELTVWSPVLSRTGWVATGSANAASDTPDKALDGTASTRWSTTADQAPGQYFQVDLQSKQSFNQLTLDAGTSTGKYPRGYEVYVSNDGTTWGSAVATGTGTTQLISITFPWQWARYVKVVQTATSAGNVWAIHELNLYGAPTDLSVLSQAGWTATKSPAGEGAASLAFDGNATTTRWSTNPSDQAPGQYFRLDLGAQRTFSQITLDTTPVATDYPAGYEVRVSNDDVTYSAPVATGTPSTAYVTISFAPQTARYIKVTQTGTKAARWTIYEMNVWAPALSRGGWLITSSATSSGNTAAKAMDNNTGTRWDTSANQSPGANQYFQIDMITPHTFNEISLDAGASPNNFPAGYEVRTSNDGSTWSSVIASGAGTSGLTTIKFLTQTARFIKITQTGTAGVHWSIYEANVRRGDQPCDTLVCSASDTCHTAGTCDVYTGTCSNPSKAAGSSCDDGNACTTGETCNASAVCGSGSAVTCPAAPDQCHTVGACVPATGCPAPVAKTNGAACDDGNACTQTDTCQAGTCTGANPVVCEERQCNYPGTCNPATGICAYQQKGDWSNCDDGNPCSVREACFSGVCTAVTNKVCAAQDQCHLPGTCNTSTGACSNPVAPDDTACNDGNACTGTSACHAGACTGSVTVTCSSTNPNEVVSCDPAAQAAYPTNDLVALWHLDGDYRDATENANHWSVIAGSNVVKVVPGKQGGAYEFGQGVCLGNNATWSNEVFEGSGLTFAAWVKPTGPCTGTHDLFRRDWQLDVQTVCTESGATAVSAGINLGAGPFYTFPYSAPAGNLPSDQWSMVAVTWDKLEGVLHIYVNGTEVATKPAAGTLARGTPYMSLGCYFVGVIDEAAWYRRALTPTELTQLMATPNACKATPRCPDPDPCRTGVWDPATNSCTSVPKANGTSCSDGNGCTQNDVCQGGVCTAGPAVSCAAPSGLCEVSSCDPTWKEPVPDEVIATWHLDGTGADASGKNRPLSGLETGLSVAGKFGDAVHFDLSASSCANRTSGPGESFVNAAGITLSAWVKPDLTCTTYHVGTIIERSGELGMRLECNGGAPRVIPSINWTNIATQAFLTPGAWSHVVTTYDRPTGSVRVYINGVDAGGGSVAPNTELGTGIYGRSAAIDVGCGAGAAIDEATILRRPLTAAEVANLYAAPTQCKVQPKTCASTGVCNADGTCNPTTGACERPQRPNGKICDDGNPATQSETCEAGVCTAHTQYPVITDAQIDDLGIRPGGASSNANDINNRGQIVGSSTRRAILWQTPASMVDVSGPAGVDPNAGASAYAVNEAGTIVGQITWPDATTHAFRYSAAGGFQDLGLLGDGSTADDPAAPYKGANAHAINEAGQFAGFYTNGNVMRGYRYTAGVGIEDIGTLAGRLTTAQDIDDEGRVFGSSWVPGSAETNDPRRYGHAIMWENAEVGLIDLNDLIDPLSGWVLHEATAGSGNYVVGAGVHEGQLRPFRLNRATGDIDDLWPGVDGTSLAQDVNSSGDVVGYGYLDTTFAHPVGFLYTDQLGIKILNDVVSPSAGWSITDANGINESGDIIGQATHNGQKVGYRLHDIVSPQLACEGKAEGATCSNGVSCGSHNVCHDFVCGGGDPADAVCLSVDGVVDMGGGTWMALFGYDNPTATTVIPTISQVSIDGTVVPNPTVSPPAWLSAGTRRAAFRPTFASGQTISWRVNGQRIQVSASDPSIPHLPKVAEGSGYGVWVGGTSEEEGGTYVTLEPDLGPYKTVPASEPQEGHLAAAPVYTEVHKGALQGSLGVGPSGASMYSVPIAVPPGVGGMAPNLSLVYNSQSGNGIAGQGWELAGLSMIQRCPSTEKQEGFSKRPSMERSDTLCLDGKHLFENNQKPGTYTSELADFTSISRFPEGNVPGPGVGTSPQTFKVVTKTGETRYYGSRENTRVGLPYDPFYGPSYKAAAAWLLTRVVDAWGNYFDLHYNYDAQDFRTEGIFVTSIDYTGHLGATSAENEPTFARMTFDYEARPDVRRVRLAAVGVHAFGASPDDDIVIIQKRRLKKITTNATPAPGAALRTYELTYLADDPTHMLPSRLSTIEYCVTPTGGAKSCLDPLKFDWVGGGYEWVEQPTVAQAGGQQNTYTLPEPIDTDHGFWGTQFVDMNMDGRVDFVAARGPSDAAPAVNHIWTNNGHGWEVYDQPLKTLLAKKDPNSGINLTRTGTYFADVDGNGHMDLISESQPGASFGPYCPPQSNACADINVEPAVWLGGFHPETQYAEGHFLHGSPLPDFKTTDFIGDMTGDGRADLVRVTSSYIEIVRSTVPFGWAHDWPGHYTYQPVV